MNAFLSFLIRMGVAAPSTVLIWLLSFFALDQTFGMASVLSLAGGALIYGLATLYTSTSFLKKNQLTRKEYRYIKKNLDEAKPKISRLQKTLFSIRHLPSLKERVELVRVIRKIYSLTKKEPKRFYLAERFYFSHLDSVLELSEKYAFLSTQPKKNRELEHSLYETRETLSELSKLVEQDLYRILEEDLDDLNFEIDVAKYSLKTGRATKIEQSGFGKTSSHKEVSFIENNQKTAELNSKTEERNSNKNTEETISNSEERKSNKNTEETISHSEKRKSNKNTEETKEEQQAEAPGPKYFINTKIEEKEEIPLKETRESRYKDNNRRFPE
jgi:5-bromo-4-chloroindolyl phosphate hydrolysis protein